VDRILGGDSISGRIKGRWWLVVGRLRTKATDD
jgi:hypothetical protein